MKRMILGLAATMAALSLTACAEDGYGYGYSGIGYPGIAYDGFYDGYYGPIYDGYWGNNGYFYYRLNQHDRRFRRGDHSHFQRPGNRPGGDHFRPMRGNTQPPQGVRAPNYPGHQARPGGGRGGGGRDGNRGGDRGGR
ncbi:MAG TPA: hypothetical protein VNS79_08790 [Sphingobium sp.]|nr:hypothetical protein [Sphingobium sp.]